MTAQTVSRDAWINARTDLLAREKELTRAHDALAAARREMPRVLMPQGYRFHTPQGEAALIDLFGEASQLLIDHFMFGADWEEGCPSCSFWADAFDGMDVHLAARDVAFVVVSEAPLDKLEVYRKRMGWRFRWVSSHGTTFNRDMGVAFTPEEIATGNAMYNFRKTGFPSSQAPGLSAFLRQDGQVYHTYSVYGRGLDTFNPAYQLLDMMPKGRDEDGLPNTMAWLRRRDQYGT